MRSFFESWARAVRSTDSSELARHSHVNQNLPPASPTPSAKTQNLSPPCPAQLLLPLEPGPVTVLLDFAHPSALGHYHTGLFSRRGQDERGFG